MKHLKIAILALLLITSLSNANAQDKENPWIFNAGANLIDVKDGGDLSLGADMSLGRYLGKGFGVELAGAVNQIEKPWGSGADATFFGLDLNVKYDLNNAFGQTGWFDPFLYAGIGENWVGVENGLGLNLGLGFNAWISDNVGINVTSGYKKVNTPIDFEMFQHSVGLVWKFGNKDRDADGVNNKEDKCPDEAGLAEFDGCADTDADKDGVKDCCDKCPEVPGLAEFDGCPDTDGDGVQDSKDKCPTVAGLKALHGCPDKDGDGVADGDDACIDVPGPKGNSGCPYKDTDEDGIIDIIDRCVETPGPESNEGCPEIFADQLFLDESFRKVYFDTNKSNIRPDAAAALDQVAAVLTKTENTLFKFKIEGHTDSTASDAYNMTLSTARANSVKQYLISKGVASNRLDSEGFGESYPIDTNATNEGRQNNRRVVIVEMK